MTSRKAEPGPVLPGKKGGGNGSAKNAEKKDEPTKDKEATASGTAPEPATRSREITKRRA